MPYIPKDDRPVLDASIELLAEQIKSTAAKYGYDGAFFGILNYCITRLIIKVSPARRYWVVAALTGVLENVKQELYRRFAAPYEDEQIAKNGDVGYDEIKGK